MHLRIPGPTPCPSDVLEAMGRQMINHRGPEFAQLQARVLERLRWAFQTDGDVLIFPASGTGGLEAAVVNTISPGDHVLGVSIGSFGERFADIAERYGARVQRLRFEWGQVADPAAVEAALKAAPDVRAVLITHNETSTGVTNPLGELAAIAKAAGKLVLVDGVSSIGSIDLPTDQWGCDVVVTGSQKGWMVPPGLAMVSVNQAAWKAAKRATTPRFYFDFGWMKEYNLKGQTPYTPAISLYYALDVGLELMAQEGLPAIFARHRHVARRARDGARRLGLRPFGDERFASATVTAIAVPEDVDSKDLLRRLREEHGVVLAGGQGKLDGKILRVGHLGWVDEADIDVVIDALAQALPEVGFQPTRLASDSKPRTSGQ